MCGLHLDGILQLGIVQHDVKAAGAHGDQLPQDDVLTHPLHPVLLSKHGRPATLCPSTSEGAHYDTGAGPGKNTTVHSNAHTADQD